MGYDKPKVTIDLEEYNELLKLKETSIDIDIDDVATTVANAVFRGAQGNRGTNGIIDDLKDICKEKNYKIELWQKSSIGYRDDVCGIKVTKKKENGI